MTGQGPNISGTCIPENSNIDVSIDGLWLDYYQRDRTWVDGANEAGFKISQSEERHNFAWADKGFLKPI